MESFSLMQDEGKGPPEKVSTPMWGRTMKNPAHEGLPETHSQTHQPDNAPDYQLQVAGICVLVLFFFILLFYKLIRNRVRKSSPHRPHVTGTE